MKFLISSDELQKAIDTVTAFVSLNREERENLSRRLEKTANEFLRDNRDKFKSTADVGNYAEDLVVRAGSYMAAVEEFLERKPWFSYYLSKKDRKYFTKQMWSAVEYKITGIMSDLLMNVFVRNEAKNFDAIVKRILQKHSWKAFAGMHILAASCPEAHPRAVSLLRTLLTGLEAHFGAFDRMEETRPYLDGLLSLLMHMRRVVENILDTLQKPADSELSAKKFETADHRMKEEGQEYPAWVFSSREAFALFRHLHGNFCRSKSDLAYLYRKFFQKGWIVLGIAGFQRWYNNWPDRLTECWEPFKTINRVAVPKRVQLYDVVLNQYGSLPE